MNKYIATVLLLLIAIFLGYIAYEVSVNKFPDQVMEKPYTKIEQVATTSLFTTSTVQTTVTTISTTTKASAPAVATINTANWNTYTDTTYNISFKYPTSFPFSGQGLVVGNEPNAPYEIHGPWGGGEYIASLQIEPSGSRTDVYQLASSVYVTSKSEITYSTSDKGYTMLNAKDGNVATHIILKRPYVYIFHTFKKNDDAIFSKIASSLDLSRAIDPIEKKACGGGAMGGTGTCPTEYVCNIANPYPGAEGVCVLK